MVRDQLHIYPRVILYFPWCELHIEGNNGLWGLIRKTQAMCGRHFSCFGGVSGREVDPAIERPMLRRLSTTPHMTTES